MDINPDTGRPYNHSTDHDIDGYFIDTRQSRRDIIAGYAIFALAFLSGIIVGWWLFA